MSKGYHGISFPFRIGAKGGIAMSSTNSNTTKHIDESIQQILSTNIGERVMEYHFGVNLSTTIFEPTDETLMNLIKFEIMEALSTFEPRIKINEDNIRVYSETSRGTNTVIAEIPYVVKDYTNTEHTAIIDLGGES